MARIKRLPRIHPPKPPKPPDRMQNMQTMRRFGATKWVRAHWRWDYGNRQWNWVLGHSSK